MGKKYHIQADLSKDLMNSSIELDVEEEVK